MKIIEHTFNTPKPYTERKKTTKIILHCAATPEGKDFTVKDINTWHLKRGFNGIGYQFVIYRDGTIHRGRPMNVGGAHTVGYNSTSVGICYIGGVAKDGKTAKDTRTDEQKKSMYELVEYLLKEYDLKIDDVYGHYQLTEGKECPSFKISKFKKEYEVWKEKKYEEELKKNAETVPPCYIKDWFK